MPQPKGKKVKKNVEPELSVENGEAVQMEETELEPPTLEMERPVPVSYTHLDVYKRQIK